MSQVTALTLAIWAHQAEGKRIALRDAIARLEAIREQRVTFVEKDAVEACLFALRDLLGGDELDALYAEQGRERVSNGHGGPGGES